MSPDEKIPFTKFSGWLKSMRAVDLNEEQSTALKITFARFFEEAVTAEKIKLADFQLTGHSFREQAYAYRRFAGGPDLPRARYYAVCNNESGNDGDALTGELFSYVDANTSGFISIWDFSDPMLQALRLKHQLNSSTPNLPWHAIGVTFQSRRGITSPFFTELKKRHNLREGPLTHMDNDFTVYFPLRVEQTSIDKTIDLRLPNVQEWFAKQVFSGIPTACYVYQENTKDEEKLFKVAKRELLLNYDEVETIKGEDANDENTIKEIVSGRTAFLTYGAHPEGENNLLGGLDKSFYALLPLLTFHPRGGNPITEAIGSWLREIGVNALIFPSARTNTHLHMENGSIKYFQGWNLVDYRNAPKPEKKLRIIQDPSSYIDTRKPFHYSTADPVIHQNWKGSFQIRGITERQQMEWIYGQELFWQMQKFKGEEPLFKKDFIGVRHASGFEERVSIAELRAGMAADMIDVNQDIEKKNGADTISKTIGQWLAEYLDRRITNKAITEGKVLFSEVWFFYRLNSFFEPQIICPICEYNRLWSIDHEYSGEKCPSCEYTRLEQPTQDEIRTTFIELCNNV